MFETIQQKQVATTTPEKKVDYAFVEDTSLIHVGGGSATAHF